ncbi:DUF1398 domain-containing protein [Peristeroidobacter soli]|uniref:DUF1398 domain-containing protein n=1 Tax=Peristeroidobacter soli TaxID=2497877 RepID=UPI00101D6E23
MSKAVANLQAAQQRAMAIRPKVGGFPYLAETLRSAGVSKSTWSLPSCESRYDTLEGPVVIQGTSLISGAADVPRFDQDALIAAIRRDQSGDADFPEFLASAWRAGVIGWEVDLNERTVTYYGCGDEEYVERYPAVEIVS